MGSVVKPVVNAGVKLAGKVLGVEQPDVQQAPPVPTPPTVADVPSVATPNVQAAAQAARRRERVASGRAATMLSSGSSETTSSNVGTKKLLGQ